MSPVELVEVDPGGAGEVVLEVVNTSAVIEGVTARVLGLPPEHVTVTPAVLPLFPDAVGRLVVRLDVPPTFPAGRHPVTVEVVGQAETHVVHHDVDLVVGQQPALALAAAPTLVRARRRARFAVDVRNEGNVALDVALRSSDADRTISTRIVPSTVHVAPGAAARCLVDVRGPRQLFGGDRDRPLRVEATAQDSTAVVALVLRQRSAVSRGLLTALVLLAIVGTWAAIFLLGIRSVLGAEPVTKIPPESFFAATALEGAAGAGGAVTPAGALDRSGALPAGLGAALSGTVVGASDGQGVGRITVEAHRRTRDGLEVVGSAATQQDGSYVVAGLFPGQYLLSFRAEGYDEVWYPAAPDATGAQAVAGRAREATTGLDVEIVGRPASITGTVDVGDVSTPVPVTVTARAVWLGDGEGAVVATTTTDDAGGYALTALEAPGTYELTFTAEGYRPTTITERVAGGQARFATTVGLGAGAGQISGTVTDGAGPVGGVTVTTTVEGAEVVVGTPTVGAVGTFVLPALPTPGTYVLEFTRDGFTPRTVVIDLAAGQSRTDVAVQMRGGAGTVQGRLVRPDGQGLGGATVTVGGGPTAVTATTLTTGTVGAFTVAGLEPGVYTLTFTLPGWAPQSVPVDLTSGTTLPLTVTMQPSLGAVEGRVLRDGAGVAGVEVVATDGQRTWTATSTAVAGRPAGYFALAQLPTGTYTVTVAQSGRVVETAVVRVTAGGTVTQDLTLPSAGGGG
nr:carboxypeptidase regulatory-like domain-containing protein [uncultured Actinotalea sp.]